MKNIVTHENVEYMLEIGRIKEQVDFNKFYLLVSNSILNDLKEAPIHLSNIPWNNKETPEIQIKLPWDGFWDEKFIQIDLKSLFKKEYENGYLNDEDRNNKWLDILKFCQNLILKANKEIKE